jgi:1,4-dihydroxy-2-naphthoyl-CoA synthase
MLRAASALCRGTFSLLSYCTPISYYCSGFFGERHLILSISFQSFQQADFALSLKSTMASYQNFLVNTPLPFVAHVQINRPNKLNAFFEEMWLELKTIFDTLSIDPEIRAIILSGAGAKAFTAGLDVEAASQNGIMAKQNRKSQDVARIAVRIKRHVAEFQDCISSVEKCEKRT